MRTRLRRSQEWLYRAGREGWPAFLIVLVCGFLQLGGAAWRHALRYDRGKVLDGQWWRLVTANFIHSSWAHLGLDLSGFVLLWLLFGAILGVRRFWIATVVGSVAVGLGVFLFSPGVFWFDGISGVLHTYWAAGALLAVYRREWGGRWLLAFLVLKLAYERLFGPLPTSQWAIGGPILTIAHLYGAIAGTALGFLWIGVDRRHSRPPAPGPSAPQEDFP
jgi:rhomboid family GlyGly-CTERM serine protease